MTVFINQLLFHCFFYKSFAVLPFFINQSLFGRFYQSIAAPEERLLARATTSYIAQIPKLDFWWRPALIIFFWIIYNALLHHITYRWFLVMPCINLFLDYIPGSPWWVWWKDLNVNIIRIPPFINFRSVSSSSLFKPLLLKRDLFKTYYW